jgi:transcriptional regulator with XRE-family HTH domain
MIIMLESSSRKNTYLDSHIGKKLRERRLELNLTQEQVGEAIGITFQQIQKYEKGLNRISSGALFKIATFLKINIAYFFEGLSDYILTPSNTSTQHATNDNHVSSAEEKPSEDDIRKLVENFSLVKDPKNRRMILDYTASKALDSMKEDSNH